MHSFKIELISSTPITLEFCHELLPDKWGSTHSYLLVRKFSEEASACLGAYEKFE